MLTPKVVFVDLWTKVDQSYPLWSLMRDVILNSQYLEELCRYKRWAWTGSGLDLVLIFEKNSIRTGSGYLFDSTTKFPWEWFKMSQMSVLVFSLLMVFIFTKNQNDLSVCAAFITINGNSCYFYREFFSGEVVVVNCSNIAGMLFCSCCAEWHNDMCVLCRLI